LTPQTADLAVWNNLRARCDVQLSRDIEWLRIATETRSAKMHPSTATHKDDPACFVGTQQNKNLALEVSIRAVVAAVFFSSWLIRFRALQTDGRMSRMKHS
jgi:hypothetical protein